MTLRFLLSCLLLLSDGSCGTINTAPIIFFRLQALLGGTRVGGGGGAGGGPSQDIVRDCLIHLQSCSPAFKCLNNRCVI